MAGQPLRLSPRLLPFRQLGLKFVLQDEPVAQVQFEANRDMGHTWHMNQAGPASAYSQTSANQTASQQNAGQQTDQRFNAAPQQNMSDQTHGQIYNQTHHQAPSPQRAESRPQSRQTRQKPQNSNAGLNPEPEFNLWPPLWRRVFLKGAPQRAPLVWTYPELGLDLLSQGNPVRSRFFRGLLQNLALPKGGNAFWPCALPGTEGKSSPESAVQPYAESGTYPDTDPDAPQAETSLVYNSRIFMSGLAYIQPKVIIVFGGHCLEGIFAETRPDLKNLNDFQQVIVFGVKILLLPTITGLQDNPDKASSAVPFIRTALAGIF